MPVSMARMECPCCGREVELILVGSVHYEDEVEPKPRRKRRSKASLGEPMDGDGAGPVRPE